MVKMLKAPAVLGSAAALAAALLLVLALQQPVQAGGIPCQATYIVLPGDTLSGIAFRLGIRYGDLLAANRLALANPDRIYAGQVLCLPSNAAQVTSKGDEIAPDVGSLVVLEGWYVYTPTVDEGKVQLARGSRASKRVELPLLPADPVRVFTPTRTITEALVSEAAPLLIGMRDPQRGTAPVTSYTLIAIGDGAQLLARLALSTTVQITQSTAFGQARPLLKFLGDGDLKSASLFFVSETADGVRMPFEVSTVDVVPDYAAFKRFYLDRPPPVNSPGLVWADDIGYALLARPGGRYQLLLRLSEEGFGPPGWGRQVRCQSWRGRRGLWFWFFSSWYGCRG